MYQAVLSVSILYISDLLNWMKKNNVLHPFFDYKHKKYYFIEKIYRKCYNMYKYEVFQ